MDKKYAGVAVVLLIAAVGMSFYGGMRYERGRSAPAVAWRERAGGATPGGSAASGDGQRRMMRGTGPNRSGQAGDFTAGEILSRDDKSITVKTREGGSRIIFVSDSTGIGKSVRGTVADLEVGRQVVVTGKNNPDVSVVAENIQIRPTEE
jgi:hypothetical protein